MLSHKPQTASGGRTEGQPRSSRCLAGPGCGRICRNAHLCPFSYLPAQPVKVLLDPRSHCSKLWFPDKSSQHSGLAAEGTGRVRRARPPHRSKSSSDTLLGSAYLRQKHVIPNFPLQSTRPWNPGYSKQGAAQLARKACRSSCNQEVITNTYIVGVLLKKNLYHSKIK